MFSDYIENREVKDKYLKEFVSLWDHWLREESDKLDMVTEPEWLRFNEFIRLISKKFELKLIDLSLENIRDIADVEHTFSSFEEMRNKTPDQFSKYVIPSLNCLISEEWDYTYIIWHLNNGAVEQLIPLIKQAKLEHFR